MVVVVMFAIFARIRLHYRNQYLLIECHCSLRSGLVASLVIYEFDVDLNVSIV